MSRCVHTPRPTRSHTSTRRRAVPRSARQLEVLGDSRRERELERHRAAGGVTSLFVELPAKSLRLPIDSHIIPAHLLDTRTFVCYHGTHEFGTVAPLGALDSAAVALACNGWLGDLKKLQGWIDSFRAQVTARLDVLASEGESFGSEAAHARNSGMSARDAAKERERSRTLGAAEGFADALSQGAVTGAHVDQLAAATAT